MNDEEIKIAAEKFARENKTRLAKQLTDTSQYIPDENPVSIFMSGSPGAGKTEYSKNFIELFRFPNRGKVIRIDADELRVHFPLYSGNNSYLFQNAVSILVDKIHDVVLDNKQSFLLDGTFSNYKKAYENVKRSVSRGRNVFIFYMYQEPEIAWEFTQKREIVEGRHIPKDVFIHHFIESRNTLEKIRNDFNDSQVAMYLIKKDFKAQREDAFKIMSLEPQFEVYLGKMYSRDDLGRMLI